MSDNPLPMTDDGVSVVPGGTYWLDADTRVVVEKVSTSQVSHRKFAHAITTRDGDSYDLNCQEIYGSRKSVLLRLRFAFAEKAEKRREELDDILRYLARLDAELAKES